jgi:succinate dehydrogenase / fumarate reductase flavoprotein subunit
MTNIPGIFAAGECEYQYHGANRLGANSLVSCIYGGFQAGPNAIRYAKNLPAAEGDGGAAAELKRQAEINAGLMKSEGTENPFKLWRELGATITEHATRPLQKNQPQRPQPVGQHQFCLHAPVEEHA